MAPSMSTLITWGDNAVSSCRLTVQPKVLELVRARFLWRCLYLERVQGVLDGVPRGPVGPPGPLELAALIRTGGPHGVEHRDDFEQRVHVFGVFHDLPA